jgi:hypothetical protein
VRHGAKDFRKPPGSRKDFKAQKQGVGVGVFMTKSSKLRTDERDLSPIKEIVRFTAMIT